MINIVLYCKGSTYLTLVLVFYKALNGIPGYQKDDFHVNIRITFATLDSKMALHVLVDTNDKCFAQLLTVEQSETNSLIYVLHATNKFSTVRSAVLQL